MINSFFNISLLPGLVSFLIAILLTPKVIKLMEKFGVIDDPSKNTHPKVIHTYPVPRGGGLAIFVAILTTSLLFLPLDRHLIGILTGAMLLVVVGLLDDKYNLNPYLRLVLNLASAAIPIVSGIGISFISNPMGGIINLSPPGVPQIIPDLLAIAWIIFVMNALNMGAKGIDGQLPGVVVVAAITIAALSLKFSADITQWPVIILASILAGAYLGFLPWNFFPQKIMPGYSGSTLAGYMLAVISILSTTKVGVLMVVLGIPFIDTGYAVVRRILSGKSPVWGDRGHLHHKLLDAGWGKRRVAVAYWLFSAVLGMIALNLNTASKLYTIIGVGLIVGAIFLWLTYKPKKSK